jgi:hypothetical protein
MVRALYDRLVTMNVKPFALVRLKWRELPAGWSYPSGRAIGTTGYRESDGAEGLFSIHVTFVDGERGAGQEETARIFALVEQMEERLPSIGERFVVIAGSQILAEGVTVDRGTWAVAES